MKKRILPVERICNEGDTNDSRSQIFNDGNAAFFLKNGEEKHRMYNNERLREARMLNNYTQSQIASDFSRSASWLAKKESTEIITSAEMSKFLKLYKLPLTYYLNETYNIQHLVPSTWLETNLKRSTVEIIMIKMRDKFRVLYDLIRASNHQNTPESQESGCNNLTEKNIRSAEQLRKLLNIKDGPVTNITGLMTGLGIYPLFINSQLLPDKARNFRHLAFTLNGCFLAGINSSLPADEKRLSLAVLLGRYFTQTAYAQAAKTRKNRKNIFADLNSKCNDFGSRLLLPESVIKSSISYRQRYNQDTLDTICFRYGIPRTMLLHRLYESNSISKRSLQSWLQKKESKSGWRQAWEEYDPLPALWRQAIDHGLYSRDKIQESLKLL